MHNTKHSMFKHWYWQFGTVSAK